VLHVNTRYLNLSHTSIRFAKRERAKSIRTKSKQDLAAILGVKPEDIPQQKVKAVASDEEIPGSDSDSEPKQKVINTFRNLTF
jgi:hypothetical protein